MFICLYDKAIRSLKEDYSLGFDVYNQQKRKKSIV